MTWQYRLNTHRLHNGDVMHTRFQSLTVAALIAICEKNNIRFRAVAKKSRIALYKTISTLSIEHQTMILKNAEDLLKSGNVRYQRKRKIEAEIQDPKHSNKRGRMMNFVEPETNMYHMDTREDFVGGNSETNEGVPEIEMNDGQ